jgi:methionyl-tRNA formyltransferase
MVKNLMHIGVPGMLRIMEQLAKMHQKFLHQGLKLVQSDVFMTLEYHEFMSRQVLNIVVIHVMLVHGSKQKEMVKSVGIN